MFVQYQDKWGGPLRGRALRAEAACPVAARVRAGVPGWLPHASGVLVLLGRGRRPGQLPALGHPPCGGLAVSGSGTFVPVSFVQRPAIPN